MSDALNYLVEARPEAIGPYLAFLKEAGQHRIQDAQPRFRHHQGPLATRNGFRRSAGPRALRRGVTPDEVLDALLMAFPALGLAKIIWAVDIILEMNIPGSDPARLGERNAGMA